MLGFILSMYYIIGEDLSDEDTDYELGGGSSFMSMGLYVVQGLLAAQEWSVIVSNDAAGFDSGRSAIAEWCMFFMSIIGTIIMMNLLSTSTWYIEADSCSQLRVTILVNVSTIFLQIHRAVDQDLREHQGPKQN